MKKRGRPEVPKMNFKSIKEVSVAVAELAEDTNSSFNGLCILIDDYVRETGMSYEEAFEKVKEIKILFNRFRRLAELS